MTWREEDTAADTKGEGHLSLLLCRVTLADLEEPKLIGYNWLIKELLIQYKKLPIQSSY